jgi:2-haloacid dehalogenase
MIKSIIFDLGNVLIYWDPKNLFNETYFDSIEKRDYFLSTICTDAWNEMQDAGRSISEATRDMIRQYPDWEPAIRDYYGRWTEMLNGPIKESVEVLRQLKESKKYKLYALTNWNACLFEIALARYDFLDWFDARIVSGEEKIRKPDENFYKILEERYGVVPDEALFIDDNLRNINAAKKFGYQTIHFKSVDQMLDEMRELKILE